MSGENGSSADEGTPLEMLVAGAVTTVTLAVAFALLAAGVSSFWIVFVVGFAGVLPMALAAVSLYEDRQERTSGESSEDEDALAELRRRYARGELTELEFERRVERLLETETIGDARRYVDASDEHVTESEERASDRNRARDRGREREENRDLNRNRNRNRNQNRGQNRGQNRDRNRNLNRGQNRDRDRDRDREPEYERR